MIVMRWRADELTGVVPLPIIPLNMATNNISPGTESTTNRRGRLRIAGVVVLLLGLGCAGVVYWTGAAPEDLSADPATARAYKTEERNIEINFGKMGVMMNNWMEDLKDPATQAVIIAAASMLVAWRLFLLRPIAGAAATDDPGA